jgi:hypothetical protein
MVVPCLIALARLFGASLGQSLPGKGFRTFASKPQNGFVGCRNCFVAVCRTKRSLRTIARGKVILTIGFTRSSQGFYGRRHHRIELFEFPKQRKRPAAGMVQTAGRLNSLGY